MTSEYTRIIVCSQCAENIKRAGYRLGICPTCGKQLKSHEIAWVNKEAVIG